MLATQRGVAVNVLNSFERKHTPKSYIEELENIGK